MQNLLKPGNLLDASGVLNEAGYATSPVKTFNPESLGKSKLRLKQWDYYYIENDGYGIAFTIADNAYMGVLSVSVMDFKRGTVHTKTKMPLMPRGKLGLPPSSTEGDVHVKKASFNMVIKNTGQSRTLDVFVDKFMDGKTFNANVTLYDEPEDSMVIATPFLQSDKQFYYNRKTIGFKVKGKVSIGNEESVFTEENAWGLLDWGRGVWPYQCVWYWAAFYGKLKKESIAFNLGYGFGDLSYATENMVFINGKAHKLKGIRFEIPRDEKSGAYHFDKPWRITASDERFEGTFEPDLKRIDHTDLKILKSLQRQIFGTLSGVVVLDDGKRLKFGPLRGFAEVVENKW